VPSPFCRREDVFDSQLFASPASLQEGNLSSLLERYYAAFQGGLDLSFSLLSSVNRTLAAVPLLKRATIPSFSPLSSLKTSLFLFPLPDKKKGLPLWFHFFGVCFGNRFFFLCQLWYFNSPLPSQRLFSDSSPRRLIHFASFTSDFNSPCNSMNPPFPR